MCESSHLGVAVQLKHCVVFHSAKRAPGGTIGLAGKVPGRSEGEIDIRNVSIFDLNKIEATTCFSRIPTQRFGDLRIPTTIVVQVRESKHAIAPCFDGKTVLAIVVGS